MESLLVPSKKTALIFGLKWVVRDTAVSKHSQISRWRADGLDRCVKYTEGSDVVYGLLKGSELANAASSLKGFHVLSAAACVAKLPALRGKTVLVSIEVPNGDGGVGAVAIVGLNRGVVVLDNLAELEEIPAIRQTFAQKVKTAFEVHGISHSGGHQVHHALELTSIVPAGGLFSSTGKLKTLRSTRGSLVVGGIATVGLVAWGGYEFMAQQQLEANKLLKQRAAARNTPQALYAQAVQGLIDTPVVPLAGAIESIRDAVADLTVVHSGFEMQRLTCAPSGACAVRFKRIAGTGASLADFRQDVPPSWKDVSAVGQDEVGFNLQIALPTVKLDRASWPRTEAFREHLYTQWQFLAPGGWRAALEQPVIQALPPGLTPVQAAPLAAMPEAAYGMPLSVNAQPWWYASADADSPMSLGLLGAHTVMVGEIELVYANKDVTFSAKGLSYVQK